MHDLDLEIAWLICSFSILSLSWMNQPAAATAEILGGPIVSIFITQLFNALSDIKILTNAYMSRSAEF